MALGLRAWWQRGWVWTSLVLPCAPGMAAVNDVLPADYFPLATGSSTLAVYAYDRRASRLYAAKNKVAAGDLDTQIVALRLGHFFEIFGRPLSVITVIPWARAALEPPELASALGNPVSNAASGMGDLRFGATTWLVAERASGQYLGVTAMVSIPTGDYDQRQVLNIGENRYKTTLSLGLIQPLGPIQLELSPEIAWFGDNTDYVGGTRLAQKTAYALTGYLRYRATANWQFHGGGQINYGGETLINGLGQNNAPDNARIMLGATFLTDDKKHQLITRLARDVAIENGFKTRSELLVRYLWMF